MNSMRAANKKGKPGEEELLHCNTAVFLLALYCMIRASVYYAYFTIMLQDRLSSLEGCIAECAVLLSCTACGIEQQESCSVQIPFEQWQS